MQYNAVSHGYLLEVFDICEHAHLEVTEYRYDMGIGADRVPHTLLGPPTFSLNSTLSRHQ